MNNVNTIEELRMEELNELRNSERMEEEASEGAPLKRKKGRVSFLKKCSNHSLVLAAAVLFDFIGLIPVICVLTNMIFAFSLYIVFGSKKPKSPNDGLKFAGVVIVFNIFDFLLGVVPANIGAALVRIAMSEE